LADIQFAVPDAELGAIDMNGLSKNRERNPDQFSDLPPEKDMSGIDSDMVRQGRFGATDVFEHRPSKIFSVETA
jgi:hypothetical protein